MSNIKKGYKQTDIGVIPEDWEVKSINDSFRFLNNATYSRAELDTEGTVSYIHYGDIHTKYNEFIDFDQNKLPKVSDFKALRYRLVQDGDIIMADASEDYVGLCKSIEVKNVRRNKAIAGLHTILMREKANLYENGFKAYLFLVPDVRRQLIGLATGMKVYGVSKSKLPQVLLPRPTLEEQTAIATALSDTGALIAALDKKIAKKQQIKQGAMQQLLTGKKRLPGFSGEWVEKRVDEFSDTSSGGTPSRSNSNFYTGNIPWVTTGELNDGYISCTKEYISEEALNCSSAKLFPANTVLMAMYGATIGKLGLINILASTNQACCAFLCDDQLVDNKFLFYKLRFIRNELISLGSGAGQPNISQTVIRNLSLSMPATKSEQTAIAQILTDMDNEIAQLEKERDKYKELKAGMMQVLLTGKIRLI